MQFLRHPPSDRALRRSKSKEETPILSRGLFEKDAFSSTRWRCLANPKRAYETLGPYATLSIDIVKGKDLIGADTSLVLTPTSDPFVEVELDDMLVYHTPTVNMALHPEWYHHGSIDIVSAMSMVRLQVLDKDIVKQNDKIGFVEFCVADIPFDAQVEGWMELRFQENLQRTSWHRYEAHCRARDDSTVASGKTSGDTVPKLQPAGDKGFPRATMKKRNGSLFSSCVEQACATGGGGANVITGFRYNAGEILVRLQLLRLTTVTDGILALAVDPPRPEHHGSYVTTDIAPMLDAQGLVDDVSDIKRIMLDTCLRSVTFFMLYIVRWRCPPLTAAILALLLLWISSPMLGWCILPGLLALIMVLLSCGNFRLDLTTGGKNATLNQQGFDRVASWGQTYQMRDFVLKVADGIGAKVESEAECRSFAAQCFRNRRPALSFAELERLIQKASWTTMGEVSGISRGSLVLVDGSYRARVVSSDPEAGIVQVAYDDPQHHGPSSSGDPPGLPPDAVDRARVSLRKTVVSVPTALVPDILESQLRKVPPIVDQLKTHLCPAIQRASDIATWKDGSTSLSVTLLLASASALNGYVLLVHSETPLCREILWLLARFINVLLGLGVVYAFVQSAPWFMSLCAVVRMLVRVVTIRRRAPDNWAFFKPTAYG